ncbi:UFGT [Symbiodinium pilosum]|uniref:UFGT protein n=1 Tax=Symbiodinium pilosum TaxID=2952 RepID=A0A812MFB8_SYMPI|nr:UFGT [Symbiodinium pilosum]
MWGQDLGDLPAGLARAAIDSRAEPAARLAALESLMQLLNAQGFCKPPSMDDSEAHSELEIHAVAVLASLLAELPSPQATEWWAEVIDEEAEAEESADHADKSRAEEALLQEALDDACRLVQRGGQVCFRLHEAAVQLMQTEAWQAKHGALLLLLRLAIRDPEDAQAVETQAAQEASEAALSCFSNTSPRVRWAALEVWARLLRAGCTAPVDLLGQAPEPLLKLCNDIYTRVRRRGLLVLLFCVGAAPFAVAPLGEKIFRYVLIPQASGDDDSREACRQIAEHLALAKDVPGGYTDEQWHHLEALVTRAS